ncbi:MAG: hypothetical protein EAY66_00725 [Sphingobacteriales bacterium]|nr:MAG: hypothetical protein EAY66_00725 [Sphingobacteriales bacterium]
MIKKSVTLLSSILWVLLPKCSLCLYAYMGVFSALGLGNWVFNKNTLLFTTVFLIINFVTVLLMLLKEKEYNYALISFVAAIIFIGNKIFLHNNMYINIFITLILIIAIVRVRVVNVLSKRCVFYGRIS